MQQRNKGEKVTLMELSKRTVITVTEADKVGGFVIMDMEEYIAETEQQLSC